MRLAICSATRWGARHGHRRRCSSRTSSAPRRSISPVREPSACRPASRSCTRRKTSSVLPPPRRRDASPPGDALHFAVWSAEKAPPMRLALFAVLLIVLLPHHVTGTTYFVRQTVGDDARDGTSPAAAWQHLAKLG